jgi:hypothetical protein
MEAVLMLCALMVTRPLAGGEATGSPDQADAMDGAADSPSDAGNADLARLLLEGGEMDQAVSPASSSPWKTERLRLLSNLFRAGQAPQVPGTEVSLAIMGRMDTADHSGIAPRATFCNRRVNLSATPEPQTLTAVPAPSPAAVLLGASCVCLRRRR